jgi:hypothetical protein
MDIYGGEYADIQKKGKELWFYICSTERPYPAFYIDYPAVDHRIIPWICWKYGAKGFLYWGGNGWHRCGNSAKKMKGNYPDTQNWNPNCNLRNGSSYLIYPAFDANRKPMPLPSLRMEIFRDGMEDYEYLYILKEELKKINNLENPESEKLATEVKEFLDLPSSFLRAADDYSQSSSDFYSMRERAAELIIKCKELVKENRKTNP